MSSTASYVIDGKQFVPMSRVVTPSDYHECERRAARSLELGAVLQHTDVKRAVPFLMDGFVTVTFLVPENRVSEFQHIWDDPVLTSRDEVAAAAARARSSQWYAIGLLLAVAASFGFTYLGGLASVMEGRFTVVSVLFSVSVIAAIICAVNFLRPQGGPSK